MKFSRYGLLPAIAALLLFSGCMPASVKHIETDKSAYLTKHFKVSQVSSGVAKVIAAADTAPLDFHKIIFTVSDTFTSSANGVHSRTVEGTATYINAGGPYVRMFNQSTSNGMPFEQDYGLSYRGLLPVLMQRVWLSQAIANRTFKIESLQPIRSWPKDEPSTGAFKFAYKYGFGPQIMNFTASALSCTFGAVVQAASVNKKLTGEAQYLHCVASNANGTPSKRMREVMLLHYGVAITVRVVTARETSRVKVVNVEVD